jgi:bifunctional DNA-binding transcriptional regulator/antitoxin component of YhaV-PrlF toxin-antitoxin module
VILTLDGKRRLSIPVALAPARPGDVFEALYDEEDDEIILRRMKRAKRSWLEVMKECPVPMDGLPSRSRELPKKLKL